SSSRKHVRWQRRAFPLGMGWNRGRAEALRDRRPALRYTQRVRSYPLPRKRYVTEYFLISSAAQRPRPSTVLERVQQSSAELRRSNANATASHGEIHRTGGSASTTGSATLKTSFSVQL